MSPPTTQDATRASGAFRAPAVRDVLPPAPLTSFVGREREVASLLELLPSTRLLTLTGAGGSGKTRLAWELASRVTLARPDGVAWVELAPFHDADALAGHVATAIGVRAERGENVDEVLATAFRDRELLLVLDNCEHLVDACARFAERHLRGAPGLRILATSREALGVAGERAWLVPVLSLPAADAVPTVAALARSEAVALFVQRARDVVASFELTDANAAAVARICRQLDGLPLAIELAAARVRVLSPAQIAERLGQAFTILTTGGRTAVPRHRTLRETIRWSYELLGPAEQSLLGRLSVFAGGFALEAAEAVCAAAPDGEEHVLDLLAALVDKSLVVMDPDERAPRYHLLETVRQYAAERLADDAAADEVRRRHAAFYLALALEAEPHVYIVDNDAEWLARVDTDYGNIAAAADWLARDPGGAEAELQLVTTLDWYAYGRGRFEAYGAMMRGALGRRGEATPRTVCRALTAHAHHLVWTGQLAAAEPAAAEAVELARGLGERRVLGEALTALGAAATFKKDFPRALALLEEAIALAVERDRELRIFALGVYGHAQLRSGDIASAVASGELVLELLRGPGYRGARAELLPGFGRARLALGDIMGASAVLAEGVELAWQSGRTWSMVHNLEAMMAVAVAYGDPGRGAQVLGIADGLRDRYGMRLRPYDDIDEAVRQRLQTMLEPDAFASHVAMGRAMGIEEAVAFARSCTATLHERATEAARAPAPAPVPDERDAAAPAPAGRAAPALQVRALGPLEVRRDGAPVPPDDWKYAKPRELLLYLLAHPDGRTREQIGLAFWPEATAAQVKNSFHVLLHHVRRTLGRADLVAFDGERYRVAWELGVELDAATFEREARAAMRAIAIARDDDAATARLEAAVALYRGEFLAEESAGDWHLETRDRLTRLHVEALAALAAREERAERWGAAAALWQRLVQADELNEHAYRCLMRCLARAGERTHALRAYERLAALLETDLEADPEPETRALYDRLRRAEVV